MIWQTYENQPAAILDEGMVLQLNAYLEKKTAQLSVLILNATHLDRSLSSTQAGGPSHAAGLNAAVEEFGRKIHLLAQRGEPNAISPHWTAAAKQINEALWSYVEVFEGCAIELFQQIEQIGFERWDLSMSRAVTSIRDNLIQRLDDLVWAIRRLEQQLKACRSISSSHQKKWIARGMAYIFRRSLLDNSLETTVRKCQKFLNFRYGKFIDRYKGCMQLYEDADKALCEWRSLNSLALTNLSLRDRFVQLSQGLNLWDLNRAAKILPQRESIRAVRRLTTQASALALFSNCLKAMRLALFDQSRAIKKQFPLAAEGDRLKQNLFANVANIRTELALLKQTMAKYRHFILETDPELLAKGSLYKWWQAPSSKSFRQLQALLHEGEQLDKLAAEFQISLESEQIMEHRLTPQFDNEVNQLLHEMGQPLASRELMRRSAKTLLNRLDSLDELGAFHADVVDYMCQILCRALLLDWKYHVLQEFPLFHQLYEIHQHIVIQDDRVHLARLNKFQSLIHQLQQWISSRHSLAHAHDIELDINDIKVYLQDFLAHIQRLEPGQDFQGVENHMQEVYKARQALLGYLAVFAKFFHHMHPEDPEQWLLRKQLLFVDQYFEAIHGKLNELSLYLNPVKI